MSLSLNVLFPACYQIYREERNPGPRSKATPTLRPSSRIHEGQYYSKQKSSSEPLRRHQALVRDSEEYESVDDDDDEEEEEDVTESLTEMTTSGFSEHVVSAAPAAQVTQRTAPGSGHQDSVTGPDNRKRLEYSLNVMHKTFSDIFTAIQVNANYQPKDVIEEERSRKRLTDFNCRLGRMLYQTKQNYLSLRTAVTKASFASKSTANVEDKLAALFVSAKGLLLSYLHFIPLSGGRIFPKILADLIEVILDIGNLTASLGFSTRNLSSNLRKLEQLASKGKNEDTESRHVLNQLARNTFGKPGPGLQRKAPRKPPAARPQSVIKPRPNKIFQARSSLARQRRQDSIIAEAEEEADTRTSVTSPPPRGERPAMNVCGGGGDVTNADTVNRNINSSDLDIIKRRLHNLELVAAHADTPGQDTHQDNSLNGARNSAEAASLELLVSRLEIMEADFATIATKYNLHNRKHWESIPLRNKIKLEKENISELLHLRNLPLNPPTKSKNIGSYTKDILEGIVNKMTDEILATDLHV